MKRLRGLRLVIGIGIVGRGEPAAAQNTDSKIAVGRLRFIARCGNLYYWAIDVIHCAALQFSAGAASNRPTLTSGFCQ